MAAQAGKVVIVTGASRGIGLAISKYLLTSSAPSSNNKLVVVSRNKNALGELSDQYPSQVEIVAGDAADFSLAERAKDAALKRWGRIDAVVVNHGTLDPVKKVAESSAEEWRRGFDVNVFSAVELIKTTLPSLRTTHGRIILTSSGAASNAYTAWGAYGASKAVLNHLAQTLAVEEPLVTTISIRPGVVDTEMQREIRESHHETMDAGDSQKFRGLKESGGLLRPEQPGHVIAKLALGAGKELSGRFLSWNDEALGEFQEG